MPHRISKHAGGRKRDRQRMARRLLVGVEREARGLGVDLMQELFVIGERGSASPLAMVMLPGPNVRFTDNGDRARRRSEGREPATKASAAAAIHLRSSFCILLGPSGSADILGFGAGGRSGVRRKSGRRDCARPASGPPMARCRQPD